MSKALRFFFLVIGSVIWIGILFTGLAAASWVLYIPAIMLPFAAFTGFCPGMIISKWLFKEPEAGQTS
jgi:hypothetical protein